MTHYLCDTNIISELMRRRPHENVRIWSRQLSQFSVSAITMDELTFGLHRQNLSERIEWLNAFISDSCVILPTELKEAQRAGEVRGQLAAIGITRSQPDMLIAATAWTHGLTLATRNTRDFEGTGIPLFNPFEG